MLTATEMEFVQKVDKLVKQYYDLDDGGDLCYNLIEMQVIDTANGEDSAARVVAQHFLQA